MPDTDGLPTPDQFAAGPATRGPNDADAPLPTPDQLYPPPQSGAAHDTIWSSIAHTGTRIINAAGYGAADSWGARPLGLDADSESALKKAGIFNDYQDGHDSFLKSVNEAWIRPAAAAADFAARGFGIPALISGAASAATQTGEEIKGAQPGTVQQALAAPFGIAGELGQAAAGGYIGPEFGFGEAARGAQTATARSELAADAVRARSVGALGEGEAGYYDAVPPTPETVQARSEAAQESGVPLQPPAPPPVDVHALARRIDPDTFEQYDALALEREQHGETLRQLADERENGPEVSAARSELNDVLGIEGEVSGRELVSRLQALEASAPEGMAERATAAFDRYDAALFNDTPEMVAARNAYINADQRMRDLAPDVSDAYRQAHEMAPDLPLTAVEVEAEGAKPGDAAEKTEKATAEGEAQAGAPDLTPEQEAGVRAAPIAAAEGSAEGTPPNVLGDEKLGNPKTFKTAKGSTYDVHEDGTTTRNKAARDDAGHEGDSGLKPKTSKTVYVDNPQDASSLSAAGLQDLGPKGARVIIRDGKASLLTWNERESKWGISPSGRDIPISDTPEIGKAPLELWKPAEDVPGHEAYANMHAGNAITEINEASPLDAAMPASPGQPKTETALPKPPTARYGNLRAVEGTGETATRGLAEGVEEKAIEDGLTDRFGDLPEYRRLSMADQARQVAELMDADYENAKAIAMGDRAPPRGVLPESVFVGVEKRALAEGDVETLRQLATRSRLNTAATTMGQRIRTLGERDATSPVGLIQEVQQAREAAHGPGLEADKAAEVSDIKAEVAKAASGPDKFAEFLKTLECE